MAEAAAAAAQQAAAAQAAAAAALNAAQAAADDNPLPVEGVNEATRVAQRAKRALDIQGGVFCRLKR